MKTLFLVVSLLVPTLAAASPADRTSAAIGVQQARDQLRDGADAQALSTLEAAAASIDRAAEHPKTRDDAKTLFLMGEIYFMLAVQRAKGGLGEQADADMARALVGYERCLRVTQYSPKDPYAPKVRSKLRMLQNLSLNGGVAHFNDKKYKLASQAFETAVKLADMLGVVDDLAVYNWGQAAERAEQWDVAIAQYRRCADRGYRGATMFSFLAGVHAQKGDDAGYRAVLEEGRAKYPDNVDLLRLELNLHLAAGRFVEAEKMLRKAIALNPDDEVLHFALGSVYDNLGASESSESARAMRRQQAEQSYRRALELEPKYFNANYNLGALYFNLGVELNNALTEDSDAAQRAAVEQMLARALPLLEKARALSPNDLNTVTSLVQLYARLGDAAKYEEAKARLAELKP